MDKPQGKRKGKTNRLRAKEHRQRKKQYIEDLESRVKELETLNLALTLENKNLKEMVKSLNDVKIIPEEDKRSQLKKRETFTFNEMPDIFKNDPDKVRFTMIEESMEQISGFSDERLDIIKDSFRDILDNVGSPDTKALYV